MTREELWNGNREPWSNLWSIKPEKSIIAWAATRHDLSRERYGAAECDPPWSNLTFVRLRSPAAAGQFLHAVPTEAHKGESN
jgi:hypothetical protein